MNKLVVVVIVFFSVNSIHAQDLDTFFNKADLFFSTYVSEGKVAYSEIHASPQTLYEVLVLAESISISENNKNGYQAFWINAYNLAVIKGVIEKYPINSPLDHDGFFEKTTFHLGGNDITLNDIEHKLLRAKFKDPRFHFVLVCGALGCPPLISQAYLPNTLEKQLEEQTTIALNGIFLKVNTKKKRVQASQIMEWYKEDFIMNDNTEIEFINTYREDKIPTDYKLTYFPYDWNLNKQ